MKYSLSSFYRDYIKEKILKDNLKVGVIPTDNQINDALSQVIKDSQEFKYPLLSSTDYYIENGETSSAKKTNDAYNIIESDLSICVTALIDQENKISGLYDTAFAKLSGLQKKINLIKQEVDNVLFESKNTDTHEELFYEKFSSLDMVDQTLTNAQVDVNSKEVTLKATEQNPIDLTNAVDNIQVVPETNPKIFGGTDVGEMVVTNIVKNNNKVWMYQLSATEALASASIDLIIRIPSVTTEINKLVLEPYSVDLKTQVNIELAFSDDGLNWTYPDGEYKKRLDTITPLSFAGTTKQYWRIRFTKFGNDGFFSNFYIYNFGLKSLNFLGKTYDKVSRLDLGFFYSKPIVFKKDVEVANLKVCESVPSDTKISYSLAPIYSNDLSEIQAGTKSAAELFYYPLSFTDKDSVTVDFLNTTAAAPIENILINDTLSYKDRAQFDYCLDQVLPAGFVKNQTTLLRDALNQNLHGAVGVESKIHDQYSGWMFDGNYYTTYLLIEDHNGMEIDLGSTKMYVNNVEVQGRVVINKGLNFIVTHRDNWKSIDLSTLPLESDQQVDPLYPYNHKYLIEGIGSELYGVDLTQEIDGLPLIEIIDIGSRYPRATNRCWAIKMRELAFDTFTAKGKNELDVFAYKIDNTNQERIVVKSNPDLGLLSDETFSIITKLHSADKVKGLIFKAIMETSNNKVSPTFTEYLVKIK